VNLTEARKRATRDLVANFLDHMGDALDHIADELEHTADNVYPAQTPLAASSWTDSTGKVHTVGSGGGGSRTARSPVERAVIDARQRLRDTEWNLWELFNAIVNAAHAGSHQATAATKRNIPHHDHARCNRGVGKRLDGHVAWQDPDCERFPGNDPVIEGMCDHCLNRYNDWRQANGLEHIARDVDAVNYRASMRLRNVEQGPGGRFQRAG